MDTVNATRTFLGDEQQWPDTHIALCDVQGLWGGRKITAAGSGQVVVQIVERGMFERRYAFAIDRAGWQRLLNVFLQYDFVTIQPADRPGIPDEARPTITLTNAAGEARTVAKWAGVADDRFEAIYAALIQLETSTQHMEPISSGPFTP